MCEARLLSRGTEHTTQANRTRPLRARSASRRSARWRRAAALASLGASLRPPPTAALRQRRRRHPASRHAAAAPAATMRVAAAAAGSRPRASCPGSCSLVLGWRRAATRAQRQRRPSRSPAESGRLSLHSWPHRRGAPAAVALQRQQRRRLLLACPVQLQRAAAAAAARMAWVWPAPACRPPQCSWMVSWRWRSGGRLSRSPWKWICRRPRRQPPAQQQQCSRSARASRAPCRQQALWCASHRCRLPRCRRWCVATEAAERRMGRALLPGE